MTGCSSGEPTFTSGLSLSVIAGGDRGDVVLSLSGVGGIRDLASWSRPEEGIEGTNDGEPSLIKIVKCRCGVCLQTCGGEMRGYRARIKCVGGALPRVS